MRFLTRRQVTRGLTVGGGMVLAGTARAHHGWGGYDSQNGLTLTGTIVDYKFINPHGELRMQVPEKIWLVTLAPPFRMENRGLTEATLKTGTTCTVVGYPSKSDPNEMRAERITLAGKTIELR